MTTPCKSNVYHVTDEAMKCEPKDRISNLPSHLLESVLECMPLRNAVRTCILSRRWRYNWARLSQLVFDAEFFQRLAPVGGEFLKHLDLRCLIISEVLLLHNGPVLKFALCSPILSSRFYAYIDKWMLFLSRNGVKELKLNNSHHAKYRLGSPFFSCSELTHLELLDYDFEPPSSFNGFQYLTSLSFSCVSIRTNVLEAVISSATLLENLTLQNCPGVDTLNISASNLKYLHIVGAFKSIVLTNTTNLVEARLCVNYHPVHQKLNLIEVFGSVPRIEKLFLADNAWGLNGIPTKLSTELLHLDHLMISHTIFSDPDEFACALCLIRSSPNLRILEILDTTSQNTTLEFLGVDTALHFEGFAPDKLQTVQILDVEGSGPELCLIKFLLASAPRLDSMFIRPQSCLDRETEVMLSRALMQFPRASPKAKIEYLEPVVYDFDYDY